MMNTGVPALNHTVQETHRWLTELAAAEPFEAEATAYSALRAVLHSLRDRLEVDEAVHLSAQMPMLVRGFYFEGWDPSRAPNDEDTREEFLASVDRSLKNASLGMDTEQATRAVFSFLEHKLSEGQVRHVRGQLPEEVQALWPTGRTPRA